MRTGHRRDRRDMTRTLWTKVRPPRDTGGSAGCVPAPGWPAPAVITSSRLIGDLPEPFAVAAPPLASSRARASGSMSRMLLVFLTLGRRKEGCVQRPEPAGDVPPLARFSEQMRGPIDATREMQEAGAMAPPPLCPPNPGRPSLGGDAVQGGQQLIVKPWTRKGPQTLFSLQRSPHPSGTPPPWGGSFRRPPTDPR